MGPTANPAREVRRGPTARLLENDGQSRRATAPAPAEDPTTQPERALLCATCGHPVTTERERISVLEAHEHRFMNPAGSLFRIGCFARADGCMAVGAPSDDYPWFPGYAWRVALCAACADHLGWYFQSGSDAFFGLRLDRLRTAQAT